MAGIIQLLANIYAYGVAIANMSVAVTAHSRAHCMVKCSHDDACNSFFYNSQDRSCHLHNEWLENVSTPQPPSDVTYYWVVPGKCRDPGYVYYRQNMCLKFNTVAMDWDSANSTCQTSGARLVTIDNAEKNTIIWNVILNEYPGSDFWIGARESSTPKEYVWQDGSNMVYNDWSMGNPQSSPKSCVRMTQTSSSNGWTSEDCSFSLSYICQLV